MDQSTRIERTVYGASLIVTPLLLATATLFWRGNSAGLVGGTLTVYSFTGWIGVFLAFSSRLRTRMPRFAPIGAALAILGCVAGTNFGVEGIVEGGLGLPNLTAAILAEATAAETAAMLLAFFIPGLLFPCMLFVHAVALLRARAIPAWCGALLCAGAIAFPASRIPRILWLAFVADALLLLPLIWLGFQFLANRNAPQAREGW